MGRNTLTKAIEAWRALSETERNKSIGCHEWAAAWTGAKGAHAAAALLRAAGEPEAKKCETCGGEGYYTQGASLRYPCPRCAHV